MKFHIPCAFEFFKNKIIHTASCFNKRCCQYSDAASFFQFSGRSEKFLGFMQSSRIKTA